VGALGNFVPSPPFVSRWAEDLPSSPTSLRDVERQQILSALEQTGWHRGKTAEIPGISPSTLYRRLRDYKLEHRNG
jgi:transcriptional regulator of acetoin/glycerol metabolism